MPFSSKQLVSAIKRRAKKTTRTAEKAGGVAGEIYGNVRYNKLKGADLRLIRGGPGDALLNTDRPKPRLVQKQIGAVQKAAFKENAKAVLTATLPFAKLKADPVKLRKVLKHLRNKRGQFQGSRSSQQLVR